MPFLLTIDATLAGRCDPSMLTQQQMVELFFTPEDPKEAREHLKGDPDDACTWEGIDCTEDGDIREILWRGWRFPLEGSIDFRMFPMAVKFVNIYEQGLRGDIDTTAFPESLEHLCLDKCFFTGTIDLGSLPPQMRTFEVFYNEITAVCNVQNIPKTVTSLRIREANIVAKTIHVGALPESDLKLSFLECGFTKVVCARESDLERVYI